MEIQDYQKELRNAMDQLKLRLAECQGTVGVIESFLYLMGKEQQKEKENSKEPEAPKG